MQSSDLPFIHREVAPKGRIRRLVLTKIGFVGKRQFAQPGDRLGYGDGRARMMVLVKTRVSKPLSLQPPTPVARRLKF